MKLPKIYWDEQTGSVYWMEGDNLAFAPMINNGTCDLNDGGIVDEQNTEMPQEDIQQLKKILTST